MRHVTMACCLTALATAQQPATPHDAHMQSLSQAVTALQHSVQHARRADYAPALVSIQTTVAALRGTVADLPNGTEATVWLDGIDAAARDLGDPDGNPATDRHDLARLRGACTACHLQNRDDNDHRGLFPNRGNAVFGNLELLSKEGEARTDKGGAVVFLEGDIEPAPPLPRKPAITQHGRRFLPPVLVVTAGTTVRFPNNDVVFHNVFSRSRSNPFDLDTYGKGVEKEQVLSNPGLVKVHCNIHPDMAADVIVLENGYAAITQPSGFWSIPDVPDGEYTLRIWHPLAEVEPQAVRCEAGVAVPIAVTVRETKTVVQHTDKHGRKYRTKY